MNSETLDNPLVYGRLVKWVKDHLIPEADLMLVEGWLKEFREANKDLTLNEALNKIEHPCGEQDHPAIDLNTVIDWFNIWAEREEKTRLIEAAEAIREALKQGKIRPADIGLYRKEEVVIKNPKKWEQKVKQLEERIRELELKKERFTFEDAEAKLRRLLKEQNIEIKTEHIDRLREEWDIINAAKTYNEQEKLIDILVEDIIRSERIIKPTKPIAEYPFKPPPEKEDFYNRWMKILRGEI
ncbi:MAG: hypothetical protein QXV17_10445 [Candidatus Micrarchaeaceae archaeon]